MRLDLSEARVQVRLKNNLFLPLTNHKLILWFRELQFQIAIIEREIEKTGSPLNSNN